MAKHPEHVEGWPGSLDDLAKALGTLRYDKLSDFLKLLSQDILRQSQNDLARGRTILADALSHTAELLKDAGQAVDEAWDVSEPYTLLDDIESEGFSVQVGAVSGHRLFKQVILGLPAIKRLIELKADREVFRRFCEVVKRPTDPNYASPWDVALATHVLILQELIPDVQPVLANTLQKQRNLFWPLKFLEREVATVEEPRPRGTRAAPGTRVTTVSVLTGRDYIESARALRRPNATGVIRTHHDSHGLCYEVRHDSDGTVGCYDPDELLDESGQALSCG